VAVRDKRRETKRKEEEEQNISIDAQKTAREVTFPPFIGSLLFFFGTRRGCRFRL
jgi:hypothetical protein